MALGLSEIGDFNFIRSQFCILFFFDRGFGGRIDSIHGLHGKFFRALLFFVLINVTLLTLKNKYKYNKSDDSSCNVPDLINITFPYIKKKSDFLPKRKKKRKEKKRKSDDSSCNIPDLIRKMV